MAEYHLRVGRLGSTRARGWEVSGGPGESCCLWAQLSPSWQGGVTFEDVFVYFREEWELLEEPQTPGLQCDAGELRICGRLG